ncbi:MAG: PIN domain-containing protein [Acidobacteriota bacterium]|nr:PIN domain-containing protein [Acidobacteriota bacterium]
MSFHVIWCGKVAICISHRVAFSAYRRLLAHQDPGAPSGVAFLSEHQDLWVSAIALHELEFGLRLLPLGQRRDRLRATLSEFITGYEDRVLPLERMGAEWAAHFRAQAHRAGRMLDLGDALIAGTARAHDLALATRNVADFSSLDLGVVNPWETL